MSIYDFHKLNVLCNEHNNLNVKVEHEGKASGKAD